MLPRIEDLRVVLEQVIADRAERGYEVDGFRERVAAAPDSYDALAAIHRELDGAPQRADWPYVEPEELAEIEAECPDLPEDPLRPVDLDDARRRAEAGFLGSVCGCVLGKPVEVRTTMAKLRAAAETTGEWPIRDYLTEAMLDALGDRHRSWPESVRERIRFVARDDDINYTVLGMLILEQHGIHFTRADVMQMWLANLPLAYTFGPERMLLTRTSGGGHRRAPAPRPRPGRDRRRPGAGAGGTGRELEPRRRAVRGADPLPTATPAPAARTWPPPWRARRRLDPSRHRRVRHHVHRRRHCRRVRDRRPAGAVPHGVALRAPAQPLSGAHRRLPGAGGAGSDWQDGYRRIHDRYGCYGHCQIYQDRNPHQQLRFASTVEEGSACR